jgi:hypothetical protein
LRIGTWSKYVNFHLRNSINLQLFFVDGVPVEM